MALSNAEKQKRWRDKRNALAREALKHRQAGERRYDTPKPAPVTKPAQRATKHLVTTKSGAHAHKSGGNSWLEEINSGLQQQLANERKLRKAAEAKLAAPASSPLTDDEKKIIRELRQRIREDNKFYNNELKRERDKHHAIIKKIDMKPTTFRAVVKCLHPESRKHVSAKELDKVCGLLTQWKKDRDKAAS